MHHVGVLELGMWFWSRIVSEPDIPSTFRLYVEYIIVKLITNLGT